MMEYFTLQKKTFIMDVSQTKHKKQFSLTNTKKKGLLESRLINNLFSRLLAMDL
jgi:hypothetical protein